MDVAVKGRARVGKSSPAPSIGGRDSAARPARGGILSATAQRAILRQAGAGDVSMREPRGAPPHSRGNVELKVTGWTKSKASTNPDGGQSSLISWLEKKASSKLGSRVRSVKIKKVCCRQFADRRTVIRQLAISGPPSFAANLRTTTAIRVSDLRFPYG